MSDSINQLFMKVIAVNLIVVGIFSVFIPVIAIYYKKYEDKKQITRLYLYLAGGLLLIAVGVLIYK